MPLSIQEALGRNDLTIDQYNGLLPQSIDAVLNMEGAVPGATVGSWVIIEDEDGHRGFESEYPGLFGLARFCQVMRLEPGLISITLKTAAVEDFPGIDATGIADYRQRDVSPAIEAGEGVQAETGDGRVENEAEPDQDEAGMDARKKAMMDKMAAMNLMMIGWLLNTDLMTFLSGEPVETHQERHQAILAELEQPEQPDDERPRRKGRKAKKPRNAE